MLFWVIWLKFVYVIILFLRLSGFVPLSKMLFLFKSEIKLTAKHSSQLIWSFSVYQREVIVDRIWYPVQSLRSILLSDHTSRDMLWIERCYQWRHEIMMSSPPLKKISYSLWNRFNLSVIDTSYRMYVIEWSFEDCMIWYMTSRVFFVLSCLLSRILKK